MKTIIKLMLATVLCVVSSAAKSNPPAKDPYHLVVEGEFLAQKHVQYTVYKLDAKTGVFISESHNKGRKYFHIMCDRGSKYIIRFQDRKGNVKFLMVEATREGYYGVNVDFNKPYDAMVKYTKNGYDVMLLTSSGMNQSIAHN